MTKISKLYLEEIIKSLKAGAKIKDIGLSYDVCTPYYLSFLIKKLTGKSITQIRHESLKEDLRRVREGKTYLFQVRSKFGYKPAGFNALLKELGEYSVVYGGKPIRGIEILALKESLANGGNPEIDSLIERGLSTPLIAKMTGYKDRQYIEHYIRGSGQHQYWLQKRVEKREEFRKERKNLRDRRSILVNLISTRLGKLSQIQKKDDVKTKVEKTVFRLQGNSRFNLNKARRLFTAYFTAQEEERAVTLKDLAHAAEYANSVSAIYFMKRANLYAPKNKPRL